MIETNKKTTISKIAKGLNLGEKTIKRDIAKLKQKGLLERIGPDRGGYWKIKKQNFSIKKIWS